MKIIIRSSAIKDLKSIKPFKKKLRKILELKNFQILQILKIKQILNQHIDIESGIIEFFLILKMII